MKYFLGGIVLLSFLVGGWWWANNYLSLGKNEFLDGKTIILSEDGALEADGAVDASGSAVIDQGQSPKKEMGFLEKMFKGQPQPVDYQLEVVAQDLKVPWSLAFTSQNRILVTERPGRIRVIENGVLSPTPLANFDVSNQSEEGLMGITLDPEYDTNKYLYICLAYGRSEPIYDKVIRVKDLGNSLSEETILLDKIPAAEFHAGCRLRFGPDGKLYISTGDARDKNLAQEVSSLAGKILRINKDGSIPTDNPYPGLPLYSFGHRNSQGFDWHPISGQLVVTEHGPSGNDGPGGGDELNLVVSGKNYGWPIISHEQKKDGMMSPAIVWTPAIAPASGMFYRGTVFPQFTNDFFFGMLRGEGLVRVAFDKESGKKIISYEKVGNIDVGRVRDVVEGPDGLIYFTTSNQDGRGVARQGDDHIYRLVPKK